MTTKLIITFALITGNFVCIAQTSQPSSTSQPGICGTAGDLAGGSQAFHQMLQQAGNR